MLEPSKQFLKDKLKDYPWTDDLIDRLPDYKKVIYGFMEKYDDTLTDNTCVLVYGPEDDLESYTDDITLDLCGTSYIVVFDKYNLHNPCDFPNAYYCNTLQDLNDILEFIGQNSASLDDYIEEDMLNDAYIQTTTVDEDEFYYYDKYNLE